MHMYAHIYSHIHSCVQVNTHKWRHTYTCKHLHMFACTHTHHKDKLCTYTLSLLNPSIPRTWGLEGLVLEKNRHAPTPRNQVQVENSFLLGVQCSVSYWNSFNMWLTRKQSKAIASFPKPISGGLTLSFLELLSLGSMTVWPSVYPGSGSQSGMQGSLHNVATLRLVMIAATSFRVQEAPFPLWLVPSGSINSVPENSGSAVIHYFIRTAIVSDLPALDLCTGFFFFFNWTTDLVTWPTDLSCELWPAGSNYQELLTL